MSDVLLSISEAAKLIGVCENTLRDWDIEGKLLAARTTGGHRRYSLEQIREYLEKNPPKTEEIPEPNFHDKLSQLVARWEKTEYLDGVEGTHQIQSLAVMLENTRLYNLCENNPLFSTNQTLWLVKEAWSRVKFKKMVSVQPMLGPCGLVYYQKHIANKVRHESEAIAAKTTKFSFSVFEKAPFDQIKDIYATAIATEIDSHIYQNLPRFNIENLLDATAISSTSMKDIYDYIIGPEPMIDVLRGRDAVKDIDLFGMPTILCPESFETLGVGGKYPTSVLSEPVFAPYILFFAGPMTIGDGRSMFMRSGWCQGKDSK